MKKIESLPSAYRALAGQTANLNSGLLAHAPTDCLYGTPLHTSLATEDCCSIAKDHEPQAASSAGLSRDGDSPLHLLARAAFGTDGPAQQNGGGPVFWHCLLHTPLWEAQLDGGSAKVRRQWGQPDDCEEPRGGIAGLATAGQDAQGGSWHRREGGRIIPGSSRDSSLQLIWRSLTLPLG
ncbi:Hypothetical predicted protein [Podarcis lilfordi]|uniref:Uncharacterized protein n=1 Tax=Podarcis lilfordi TaxID=74358 RepID=A0AA35KLP0_9SAUR|nr:Hypothetical predicted protein [Podarcis lilfordi]